MGSQLPLLAAAAAASAAPEMGVYVGIQQMEYAGLAAPHLHSFGPYNASGSPFSVAAGRLSFTYGLKGNHADLQIFAMCINESHPKQMQPALLPCCSIQAHHVSEPHRCTDRRPGCEHRHSLFLGHGGHAPGPAASRHRRRLSAGGRRQPDAGGNHDCRGARCRHADARRPLQGMRYYFVH